MTINILEQIVGPINRGALASGFPGEGRLMLTKEQRYFEDEQPIRKTAVSTEDLSWMNPRITVLHQANGRRGWRNLTPEEQEARRQKLSEAGTKGGRATRNIKHNHA